MFSVGVNITSDVPGTIFPALSYNLIVIELRAAAVFFGYTVTEFNLNALVASNDSPLKLAVAVPVPVGVACPAVAEEVLEEET